MIVTCGGGWLVRGVLWELARRASVLDVVEARLVATSAFEGRKEGREEGRKERKKVREGKCRKEEKGRNRKEGR